MCVCTSFTLFVYDHYVQIFMYVKLCASKAPARLAGLRFTFGVVRGGCTALHHCTHMCVGAKDEPSVHV